MKVLRKDAEQTRQSLLAAGSAIFSDKGYRDTTIADICEHARANIAAVNYHFRDKETLYKESWRYAFQKSIEIYPPDGGVSDDAPPEERLRGQVAALLRRVSDEGNKEFLILLKEIANPTGLLKDLVNDELGPIRKRMEVVVGDILGKRATKTRIQFCTISILMQCVNVIVAGLTKKQGWEDDEGALKIDDVEEYVEHVVGFSLAGISSVGKNTQASRGSVPPRDRG